MKKEYVLAYVNGMLERNRVILYNLTDQTYQKLLLDNESNKWSAKLTHSWSKERLLAQGSEPFQNMVAGYGFQILDVWEE